MPRAPPAATPRLGRSGDCTLCDGTHAAGVLRPAPACASLLRRSSFAAAILAAAVIFGVVPVAPGQDDRAATGARQLRPETELVVGVSREVSLYSEYRDGLPTGFAVDVLDAVAAEMQLRIRRVPLGLHEIPDALQSGRIDMVQFWAETPERQKIADFSVPVLLLKLTVAVRSDETRIRTLDDLNDKVIATGSIGSVASEFAKQRFPGARIINTGTPDEVLASLARGECDAAVAARLSVLWGIKHLELTNVKALDLPIDGYDVRHCMAVRKGDAVLLGRLNEGLSIIRGDGRYAEIYHRWFGAYEPRRFSQEEVTLFVAGALGLGMAAAIFAFLRQRRLTRRIASQASELLGQRSLHAALFDNHPLSTCVLEAAPDGGAPRVLSLNRVAGQLCGVDPVAATGRALDTLSLSAELRGYFDEVIARWPASGETAQVEIRLRDSRTVLETTLVALAPGSCGSARMCVLSADVTRRRLADREIAQNRRLRALGELVGGIAHEFNNLLTPVLAQATMLARDRSHDSELVSELGVIEDAARRSATLTRRLLAFGRRADDAAAATDAKAALESCVALLRPTFDRRIEWALDLPAGLPPVGCDPTDLHQIAFNLIINARDTLMERLADTAAPERPWTPRLELVLRALPAQAHLARQARPGATLTGWQQIVVADTGKGIAPEHIEHIYEPFFTTKEVGRGTGIGLATVWHLVNEAGGIIDVESTVGAGTRFILNLPIWTPLHDAAAAGAATPDPAQAAAARPCSVLLVEDEGIVASAITAILHRLGHRVTQATDGETAWREMQAHADRFDVLLVDINMPRMNGVDFVRHVRATPWAGRIVVMSGRVSEPDLRQLEQLHVHRVLIKPFTPEEVTAALAGGAT